MDKNEIQSAVTEAIEAREAAKVAEATKLEEVRANVRKELEAEAATKAKELKPAWKGGFATKRVTALGFADEDRQSLNYWLRTGDEAAAKAAQSWRIVNDGRDPSIEIGFLKAAMTESSSSLGGSAVPNDFYAQIVQARNELSYVRAAGAKLINTSRDVIDIPIEGVSSDATTTFVRTAEGSSVDENEPIIESLSVTVHSWTKLVKVGVDLMADQAANLDEFLSKDIGDKWAMTENRYVAVGTGTNQHYGVFLSDYGNAGAPTEVNLASDMTFPGLNSTIGGLSQEYAEHASWLSHRVTETSIRALTATSGALPMFPVPSPMASGPGWKLGGLYGSPYFNQKNVAASSDATSDAPSFVLCYGDFSYYALVERSGLVITRLVERFRDTRQIGILAEGRQGGAPLRGEAFVLATITPNA